MRNFLHEVFSESNAASFSRLGSFLALLFSCGWVSYIVWKTGSLPGLDGVTFFIVTLYGLGKVGQTVQRALSGKGTSAPQAAERGPER